MPISYRRLKRSGALRAVKLRYVHLFSVKEELVVFLQERKLAQGSYALAGHRRP
jgi:hypothetical protein